MKKEILSYLIGLTQAASAALLASAVIVPNSRVVALLACHLSLAIGIFLVFLKHKGK